LGVKRHVVTSRWGLIRMTSGSIIHIDLNKPNNKLVNVWLEHFWCLEEATTFPLIVFSMISHRGYIQMSLCLRAPKLGVSKFPKLGLPALWRVITSCANLWLKWDLKQSYNPCWKLSNDMWHVIYKLIF
jgi:hypothetical protein